MKKYGQSSIWDSLVRIMPELSKQIRSSPDHVDPIAAQSLYNVWRTAEKKETKVYAKPVSMGCEEVRRMKDAGLIQPIQNQIKITAKGEKVLRVMILGDERSVFEDDGKPIDYTTALNNMKGVKTAKKTKAAQSEQGWWDRFNIEIL